MSMDDANLVLLVGRLAGPVELRRYPTAGTEAARFEVSVRSPGRPPRVDVLPVVWWDPPTWFATTPAGTVLQVAAGVRRRFRATEEGRDSRLELVAAHVEPVGSRVDPGEG